MQLALDEFERLPQPTIARLHGFCIGGGLLLALCCDFRIASQRTVFAFPEIRLGIAPLWGAYRVTRTAGLDGARELLLLGERFNAKTALSRGIVNRLVAPDDLENAVAALADKFRRLPPRSVGMVKRIINASAYLTPRASEDMEIDAQAELIGTPDLREAVESYLAGREPHFTGQ